MPATTYGTPSNDVLIGIDDAETMYGSGGNDRLLGFGGDDTLIGGTGNDTLEGGAGTDVAQFDGHFSGFRFEVKSDGYLEVKQVYRSEDRFEDMGEDKLKGIETLAFWDRTLSISTLTDALGLSLPSSYYDSGTAGTTTNSTATATSSAAAMTLYGTSENDTLIGGDGNDTLIGSGGDDRILGGSGNDSIQGGTGNDTIDGGAGTDTVVFDGNFSGFRFKMLENGALQAKHFYRSEQRNPEMGTDELSNVENLAFWDRTVSVSAVVSLLGLGSGSTTTVTSTDVIVGGESETETELSGDDHVRLSGISSVRGDSGAQFVDLADGGNSLTVSGIESVLGGNGTDRVDLGATGNTIVVAGVEVLVGGSGDDDIRLGNRGSTILMAGIERLAAGYGNDMVTLGNRGSTMSMTGVEVLVGGSGNDVVTLGDAGNTVLLRGIDTLAGGAGTDVVILGNRGVTIAVSNVERITGGERADTVTVTSGGTCFMGGKGADTITLATGGGAGADVIAYRSIEDGSPEGSTERAPSGYDAIYNFDTGQDKISLRDELASKVDRNRDGSIAKTTRNGGELNVAADEFVALNATVSSLTDTGFAAFRAALGTVATGGSEGTMLVLASDGTNSGLYSVKAEGSGTVGANDVHLLGVLYGVSSPAAVNVVYGV